MKKTLVILLAALLMLSITACNGGGSDTETGTGTGTGIVFPVGTGEPLTDTNGDYITDTNGDYVMTPEDPADTPADINEANPTFTDCSKVLYVTATTYANVRSSTTTNPADGKDNIVGKAEAGTTLTATKESKNWYRVEFKDKDGKDVEAYVAKIVVDAVDKSVMDSFVSVENETITISSSIGVNVRRLPTADSAKLGTLSKGAEVIRVAKGEGWSRILFPVTSEAETTADGKPVQKIIECYITNEAIAEEATTEAATAATTEVVTEVATEVATEAATAAVTE